MDRHTLSFPKHGTARKPGLWAVALLALWADGCGALKNFSDYDPRYSTLTADLPIAPADGNTTVTLTARLRYSERSPAVKLPVALSVSGTPVTLSRSSGVTDANGEFTATLQSAVPGTVHVVASLQGTSESAALTTAVQFVSVAAGASLAVGLEATVGTPVQATVTILDQNAQRVLYYDGTVAFGSSDAQATLPGVYRFTSADQGQHVFDGIVFATAGTQSLRVADAGRPDVKASVDNIEVFVKTAPMLEVTGVAAALAGTINQVQVRAVDISKQTRSDYAGTVHFTSTDRQADLPADTVFTPADAGIKTLPLTLKTAGLQAVSAVDTRNVLIGGTQEAIVVSVLADRFAVDVPAPPTAGAALAVRVRAVDGYANADPNYVGNATLTSSDTLAILPPVYQFTRSDAGMHDTNVTFFHAGNQNLTAQGPDANFAGVAHVVVGGADANSLTLTGPAQAVAGSIATFVATAFDAWGNVSNGYAGRLSVSSSDANAGLPAGIDVTPATSGSAVVSPVTFHQAGAQTVTVTDANHALSANAQLVVVGGAAARFDVAGLTQAPAGTAQNMTVSARDAYGNTATGYGGVVQVISDDPLAHLPAPTLFVPQDAGVRQLAPVMLKTAGLRHVDVADANAPGVRGSQGNVLVTPLAASALVVTAPAQATAGVAQPIVVRAVDVYGNVDPNFTGVITLASSDAGATLPGPYGTGAGDAGQVTLGATLYTAGSQSVVATSGNITSAPAAVDVVPAAATRLGLSGLTGGSAGRSQNLVVQAFDNFNNVVPGYVGTLRMSSSDTNAVLPGAVNLGTADAGQKLVPVALLTAGNQNVSAQDTAVPSIQGTQQNVLIAAVADRLRVRSASVLTAGTNFNLTVAGADAYGNIDTTYTGTVGLSTTSASSTLPATLTVGPGMGGTVGIGTAALTGAGDNLSITAQDTVRPLFGTRSGIRVQPSVAVGLQVQSPNPARVDAPFSATLTAYDAYNNQATGYAGAVMLSSSDPNAVLGGITTFVAGGQGSAIAAGLTWSTATASATLTATDVQNTGITGSQNGIVVNAGGAARLRVTGATSGLAGHSDTVTVTALDSRNNVAPGYTGTVHVSSSDAQAALPANYAFVSGDAGVHTFSVTWRTAGVQSLSAQDTGNAGLVATQGSVVIAAGAAQRLQLTDTGAGGIIAGAVRGLRVAAVDGFGNVDPNYTGAVTLSSSDTHATLPAPLTLDTAAAGALTTTYALATAGTQWLSAADAGAPALTGNLLGLVVQPGPLSALRVSGIADALAGTLNSATVDAVDAQGNRVPTYTGTVHLTSSDPAAQLASDLNFGATDAGRRSAPLTLFTAGSQSVTATDTQQGGVTGTQTPVHVLVARTRLRVLTPTSVTAGTGFNITVAAVDAYGNVDLNYTGTVALTGTDARVLFGAASTAGPGSAASVTFTGADAGQKSVPGTTLYGAATDAVIFANDGAHTLTGQSARITVNPGAIDHIGVGAPAGVSPGAPFVVQVSGMDNANNVVPGYTGSIAVVSTDPNATQPSSISLASGDAGSIRVGNWVFVAGGPQTLTLTDTHGVTGNATVVVAALAPTALRVQGATSGVAGHIDSVVVTAVDSYGNPANGNIGGVTLTATDARASLPGPFAMGSAPTHTFGGVQFTTVGVQTLRATALPPASAVLTGLQGNIVITRAATSRLSFTGLQDTTAGVQQNVTVAATDIYGNLDPNASGTIALSSTDPNGTMPGSVVLSGGSAQIAVTLKTVGTQSITGTGAGLAGTSANAAVTPAQAATLRVTGIPASRTAGQGATATVTAYDRYGNVATGYLGKVLLNSTDPVASLASPLTFSGTDNGQRSAAVTFFSAGTQTLTAVDAFDASITGQQTGIVVTGGNRFVIAGPSAAGAGQALIFTVTAVDNSNTTDASFTGTVQLTSTDPCATLPANVTFAGADAGQKVVTGFALVTAGNQRVMAATLAGDRAGVSPAIAVAPGAAHGFSVAAPTEVVAGSNANAVLTVVDAYNNPTSGYTGTAILTTSDPRGTLPPSVAFGVADAGVKTVVAVLRTATGNAWLRIADANAPAFAGQQGNITVLPQSTAAALTLTGLASGVAGHTNTAVVSALDAYGNRVPQYRGEITWTSSDPLATLPGLYDFVGADQGTHAAAGVVLATVGNQTVTVRDGTLSAVATVGITPAAATSLVLDTNHRTTSGLGQNVVVTATDPYGNTDTNFSGTVTLSSSDPLALTPNAYAFVGLDAGRHTLPLTWESAGTQSVSASAGGGVSGTLNGIVVDPGPTVRFSLSLGGAPLTGASVMLTVNALDAAGNITPAYRGTAHTTSSDPGAALPADYAFTAGAGGTHTLAVTFATSGTQSLTVTDTVASGITKTLSGIAVSAPPVRLRLALAATTVAGASAPLTVQVMDNFNNLAPSFTGNVLLSISDPQATHGTQTTFAPADQGNRLLPGTFKTAGTQTVIATDPLGVLVGAQVSIAVTPAATQHFDVSTPGTVSAGGNVTTALVARDLYGNRTPSYTGSARLSSSDAAALLPPPVAFSGGAAAPGLVVLYRAGSTTLTATDTNQSAITGTSPAVIVTPLSANTLLVAGATSGAAGHAQSVTVSARDIYNNVAPDYTGYVTFASSDPAATLPVNYRFVGGDAGSHVFSTPVLATAGNQWLAAADTQVTGLAGSQNGILITAGGATRLTLVGPGTVVAGTPLTLNIGAVDGYGNIDPNFRGTVSLGSGDTQAVLPGPYPFVSGDAGRHDANVTLRTAGTQSVTASASGVASGVATIGVAPGAIRGLSLAGLAAASAGTLQTVVLRAVDNYNNTTPDYRGTVTFSSSDSQATLPGNYNYLNGDAGTKSFSVTLLTRGLQQVRAIDTLNPNLSSAQNAVVGVAQTQLSVAADTNVTAGVAFNVTISATDVYGNINPNYVGTVHLTSSDGNPNLPADLHFVSANQGVIVLNHQTTFRTAGSQSLTATDSGNSFTGTRSGIVVNAAPAAALAVSAPATVIAGAPFTLGVTAYDAYNNVATGYGGRIALSASDPNAVMPGAVTFASANLGTRTFSNGGRLVHAGVQLITVNDANNMLTGSTGVTVQSAGPVALGLSAPTGATAGVAFSVTLTAYDAYGNTATGMNDTVTFSGSDTAATYPGAVTFTPADAGTRTLTNLTTLRTAGTMSVIATDGNSGAGVSSATSNVAVGPAPIAAFAVNAPASVTVGNSFSATVAGVDAYANVVNNYNATVPLFSTDANGLPSSGTPFAVAFTSGSAAQRTLGGLRLATVGTQLLQVADPNNAGIFGSTQVQVTPGATAALAVSTAANPGANQAVDVTVTALDAGGNPAPDFVGTVSFSCTDANATVPGTMTFSASDHGHKTASASLVWHRAGSQTLTVSGSGLTSGSAAVTVSAAAAAALQLSGLVSGPAGTSNTATLRAVDLFGNTAPTYTGSVSWGSSDAAATLPGLSSFAAGDAGSKTFALRLYTGGVQSVTATDTTSGFAATQNNIFVGVQASRFVVTSPNTAVAGAPFAVSVSATDGYGNLDANFTGPLHWTGNDANAIFPIGASFALSDHGQRTVSGITLTTVNPNARFSVLDNTNTIVGNSNAVSVGPGNANRFRVTTASSTPAGTPLTATVTPYDAYANVVTGYTGTVAVTTSNANAILPAPVAFAGSGNNTLTTANIYLLSAASNSNITVTDAGNGNVFGVQSGIVVTPLGVDHFAVGGLTNGVAGHTGTLNVAARDIYNNTATSYRGTVTFTSSDAGAGLPANYGYQGTDAGVRAFSGVTLATVGIQSVTVRDKDQTGIAGLQNGIVVTSNSATRLTLTGATATTAGIAQNILVAALDAYGNIDPNFAGSVAFSTTDPNVSLQASYVFSSSDAGTHTVPLTYRTAGTQSLTATGPAQVGNTVTSTVVSPANANAYVVNGIPNLPAGQATSVTVRVIDAYNNTVPLYRGRAHLTSSDANAALPNDYTYTGVDNGIKSLGLTFTTVGTQWVRATDTNTSGITGQQNGIVVGVAQSHLQVTCNTNVTAGVAFPVTVTAVDAFGNLNTGYTGVVHFTSSDGNATLPGNANIVAANNGTITVAGAVLRTSTANQSITATDTNVPSYTGAQSGIRVNSAGVQALVLSGPSTATAGVALTPTLTAYDNFNNVVPSYVGTVVFSTTDPNGVVPGTTTFSASNAGTQQFPNGVSFAHVGNQNVVATDANNALSATLRVAVGAAAPTSLTLTTPATSTAGNVIVAQVQAFDSLGNLATSYRGTVAISSGDPNASYPTSPTPYTFTAADNGNHVFASGLVLRQSGSQTLHVADTIDTGVGIGTSVVSVSPAPLNRFAISAPGNANSGAPFVVTLSGLDIYGNVANAYSGTTQLTSTDANGVPSVATPIALAFSNGSPVQRSVSGVTLYTSGSQILYARDANNPATLNGQANVTVTPQSATTIALSGMASPVAGQQGNVTLTAYDSYGNIASSYVKRVTFASSDPNAALPGAYTFVSGDLGQHTFNGATTLFRSGNQNITATDANGLSGVLALNVAAGNPNRLAFTGQPAASAVCSAALSAAVTFYDAWNNVAGAGGAVSLRSASHPSQAALLGTTTVNAAGGIASFSGMSVNQAATGAHLVATSPGTLQAVSSAFNITATAPAIASAGSPVIDGANITIPYAVSDVCGANANVVVEVSVSGPAAYVRAIPGAGSDGIAAVTTSSNPAGQAHNFLWNSQLDLPNTSSNTVYARITAVTRGTASTPYVIGPFSVNNAPRAATSAPVAASNYPTCLALADLNHDAKIDLVRCNEVDNGVSSVDILAGDANGSFALLRSFVTLTGSSYADVGDINRDGAPDLVIANALDPSVSVILLTKAGAQVSNTAVSMPSLTSTYNTLVKALDVNSDGKLDLVTADTVGAVNVALGNGDGTFGAPTHTSVASNFDRSIAVADINRDTRPDIVLTRGASNAVYVLFANGSGGWSTQTLSLSTTPIAVATGDFNRDAKPDIAVAVKGSNNVAVYWGAGTTTLGTPLQFTTVTSPNDLIATDYDGDGQTDLVVRGAGGSVMLHRSLGNATFDAGTTLGTAVANAVAMQTADLKRDGRPDIFVSGAKATGSSMTLLTNITPQGEPWQFNTARSYFTSDSIGAGSVVQGAVLADVNGDGSSDMVACDPGLGAMQFWANDGHGAFGAVSTLSISGQPFAVTSKDFNLDKIPDFAIADAATGIRVYMGTGSLGTLTGVGTLSVAGVPADVTSGDVNRDGFADIVAVTQNTNTMLYFAGTGSTTFAAAATTALSTAATAVKLTDVNNDGLLDAVVLSFAGSQVSVLAGDGNGNFASPVNYPTPASPNALTIADVNNDSYNDLIVGSVTGQVIDVLTNKTTGLFNAYVNYTPSGVPGVAPYAMHAADFNQDGNADLALYSTYDIGGIMGWFVAWGDGHAGFSSVTAMQSSYISTKSRLVAGDVNGDGFLDLANTDGDGSSSTNQQAVGFAMALSKRSGGFRAPSPNLNGFAATNQYASCSSCGYPTYQQMQTVDYNNDGATDLEFASPAGIRLWANDGTGNFTSVDRSNSPTQGTGTGIWLAMADINGDTWPDAILDNQQASLAVGINNKLGGFTFTNISKSDTHVGGFPMADWDRNGTLDGMTVGGATNQGLIFSNTAGALAAGATANVCVAPATTPYYGNGTTGDIDNNGTADVVMMSATNYLCIGLNNGSGSFSAATGSPITQTYGQTVLADINLDGNLDLVSGTDNTRLGPVYRLGNGDGTFGGATVVGTAAGGQSVAVADINRDGLPDIVFLRAGWNHPWIVRIYPGRGDGTFDAPISVTAPMFYGATSLGIADFDADGRPDIAVDDGYYFQVLTTK